ncbi:MAG: LamB/YcsF family protein, partial [Rhodospirillales bacterium]|nr:LamB/YcsF family protein [Rhodospirillales bacterium]
VKLADPALVLMGLAGTKVLELARAEGLAVMPEIFADRGYTPQGLLVPRRDLGAVLHDADQVAERMLKFVRTGSLTANDGTELRIAAGSICVHGDSPGAVAMAKAIRLRFEAEGIAIKPFA